MNPRRYELSDFEWSIIQPLLPNKPRGVPRADDRKVLNGIYWRLRTGSPWADIPERYDPPTTFANRFRRWAKIGVWDRIFEAISTAYDGDLQMIDSSSIRVCISTAATSKRGTTCHAIRGSGPRSNRVHGAFARRPDHQDPRVGRCERLADCDQAYRRTGARRPQCGRHARQRVGRADPAGRPRLRQQRAA
jgi:transposase